MKNRLEGLIRAALQRVINSGEYVFAMPEQIAVDRTRDKSHGDYASNIALILAKQAKTAPRQLASAIVEALADESVVAKCEIAGPGFINFFLVADSRLQVVDDILQQQQQFGRSLLGAGKKLQVEFVSANPTGPLHVGHGRGAAYGATIADLLEAVGYEVQREYYVNDAGRQMDILAVSVWLRYLELCGEEIVFPINGYKGDYVWDIAAQLHRIEKDSLRIAAETVFANIIADEPAGGDKEKHIDQLITRAKQQLQDRYMRVFNAGLETILGDINKDLAEFGVNFSQWYSERSLVDSGAVQRCIEQLQQSGHIYNKDGTLWFRSTDFGDEKDRVVVRDNGAPTYFASDIAYHAEKFARGFDHVIDIWGADHHGYIPRVKAALQAMGLDVSRFEVLLVQFAVLYRGGEKIQMSTRSGEFVTLRELRDEVGNDAARFFYVMRRSEQHVDFDLDLAKSQSNDNPVYYIQYAHARVCSVMRQLAERQLVYNQQLGLDKAHLLVNEHEQTLLDRLGLYPEVVERAALAREPHQLVNYLRELANDLHSYYNAHHFIVEDEALRNARLVLASSIRQVIYNGLTLLGLSAPEQM